MKTDTSSDLLILISEKGGKQARDNGFAYFQHRISKGYKNTFYVHTKDNLDLEKLIPYSKNIVLKNSRTHKSMFYKADYLLLNDGYMDVFPTFKSKSISQGWSPIAYLQHGIITYKRVHFYKGHYNGRIRYFHTSLKTEKNIVNTVLQQKKDHTDTFRIIKKYNHPHFKSNVSKQDLEILYTTLLSDYYNKNRTIDVEDLQSIKRLITNIGFLDCRVVNSGLSRHLNLDAGNKKSKNNILFFFTWRDEWTSKNDDNKFIELIDNIYKSTGIIKYARNENLEIAFYLHEKLLHLKEKINSKFSGNIKFVGQDNFKTVLDQTSLCVTDYSSIAFEFNLIKTPVIFLQFDYDQYKYERGHYLTSPCDFLGITVSNLAELEKILERRKIKPTLKAQATQNFRIVRQDYENYKKTNEILDLQFEQKQKSITYFCYNAYGIGGTVQTIINQANYLVSIGYQVSIISLRRTDSQPKSHLDPSVRLEYLNDVRSKGKYRSKWENLLAQFPSKLFRKTEDLYQGLSLLTDIKLYNILKTINNTIIVGSFPGLCVNIVKFAPRSNTLILQEHKELSSHSPEIQKDILKHYGKAHKVIGLTKFQNIEYQENGINNVTNIPNGMPDRLPLLEKSLINEKPKRIISFGRLVKDKQFDLLIKSFALIGKKYPEWKVDIYGDGEEKEYLNTLIRENGFDSQISIHAATSLVYEEIHNSSFCALTTLKEGFGMVYIESFSMGKPVVSFDIGYGPKEFLINNHNSLVAECFSIEQFSHCLEKLINDESLLKKLGENARKTYLDNYEISKVMSCFLGECN
ncbi:glycosyltransferase [Rahnella aceris]|jgi:glycosyltransferase involved in cell wall biosynthesis|uniref:glycosyltransferase n=2 Tax=Rahnella sp. (strain Y9602) TaxID=2703885 RepID=UPI000EB39E38|nr:glycosyltransferase [Rahnella aceris]MBU9841251.1 glycosyltransferase [Rahnella aceris]RKT81422.1 glycosyltransferase involved in cell wall biosynthesis [Rahnella aquatilis]